VSVYIYTRFSPRRNAAESQSNETQYAKCQEWGAANGVPMPPTFQYEDKALSGKASNAELLEDLVADRPGLKEMLNDLSAGDVIIVYDLDRLARDTFLGMAILKAIQCRGARLATVSAGFVDLSDDSQELLLFVRLWAAKQERKSISRRTSDAMRRHQANGRKMSKIPGYGWQDDPDDPARMIPNEGERESLEVIRSYLAVEGLSDREIARQMNDNHQEHKSRSKGGAWSHQFVGSLRKRGLKDE